jgi:NlpC/P60 family putative phage cell wall peptidase
MADAMTAERRPADPARVNAIAERWIGTPYLHQGSARGLGADCLGLARGIWRELAGADPFTPPPYSRDWGEVGTREVLLDAARAALIEVPLANAHPGTLLLFRMAPRTPAKHCALLVPRTGDDHIIHARESVGVIREPFSLPWRRRAVAAFLFPG